jgi:hypothetical protein
MGVQKNLHYDLMISFSVHGGCYDDLFITMVTTEIYSLPSRSKCFSHEVKKLTWTQIYATGKLFFLSFPS